MISAPHPAQFIDPKLSRIIREAAAEAEKLGALHPQQLAVIYEQQWFNLFVPRQYNGLQLSLPDALQIEEGLAWADGSTGWTVTLCSGAAWFVGFLQEDLSKIIFSNPKACFAGSGNPSGIAKITANGYEINGRWNYASGAPHATVFTANCLMEKNGAILLNEDGSPQIRAFLFLREEVTIHKNWPVMGMIATASHSFEVSRLSLASERCFIIDDQHTVLDQPVYRYPFLQFAAATLAVNSSGMAMRFLDCCEMLFEEKSKHNNHGLKASTKIAVEKLRTEMVEEARMRMQEARTSFYTMVHDSWEAGKSGRLLQPEILKQVSLRSYDLAACSREIVDKLYPYCGLAAADPSTEINRVWRNLHTASQHPLLNLPLQA